MKNTIPLFALLLLCFLQKTNAQTWAVHLNGNETYPISNDLKSYHPILWYSSSDDRGILVGGFGLGISYQKTWKENLFLKFQANVQRSRFYDQPTVFTDENGNPLGAFIGINTNLNASLLCLPTFYLSQNKKWLFGIGLGMRGTFFSKTDFGEAFVNGEKTSLKLKNKSLSPAVLLLPLEFTKYFGKRFFMSTRGEFSLTKTSRLSAYKKERNFLAFVEVGFQLTNPDKE